MPIPGKPIHAITPEARHLKDLIFAKVRARGIALQEVSFRIDEGDPCVRFSVDGVNLAGARIRIRDGEDMFPKVVTISGASEGWSRSWQRRRDQTFDIVAVADFLAALIEHERARPPVPELRVPSGVPAEASGLHVMHLAAIRLRMCLPAAMPEDLLGAVNDERRRARIGRGLAAGGLMEADLRVLSDALSLHLYRPNKPDFDLFEPLGRDVLPLALVGRAAPSGIERRYVLVLECGQRDVMVADPAGEGLVTLDRDSFWSAWKLAERRGIAWVGLVTPMSIPR
jgi:hypothetical protein